tara:strand:+ start:306 stop:485 length:180 start_codon:yes stop_codon:yes gene_type:complete
MQRAAALRREIDSFYVGAVRINSKDGANSIEEGLLDWKPSSRRKNGGRVRDTAAIPYVI